ncbi:FMN-dependent NADH-azoreductase [Terriglobus tenax]|uniref:FMN-dependent NADH-azoreductase n=1 Tax=Terriglobus tenax TaxID=1111115 RepID=UPI0021E027C8|nr:NAD(P)H-dependent oxidoreductase [Terriglobus tenax]
MPTLLRIDSSPLSGHSVSREMTDTFVASWKASHADGQVVTRDLATTALAPIDAAWIRAIHTPADSQSVEQKALLTLSEELIAELYQAEEYVIGVPMHNFGIPSTLKLWIDLVSRAGKTFAVENGAPVGLLKGKKVTFLVATGFEYGTGSPMAAMNNIDSYLRTLFSFFGVTELTFLTAGGTIALNYGQDRATFLQPHLEAVQSHAQHA